MPRKEVVRQTSVEIWRIVSVADRSGRLSPGPQPPSVDRSDWRPASPRGHLAGPFVLDMISVFLAIIASMLVLFSSIPFIATADWLVVPIAVAGLALGLLSGSAAGRNLNPLVILLYLIIEF